MFYASICHHYMLTVICRLPISPLSSLSLKISVSSAAFCKHQVTQQLVRHRGSVRPDEQTSVAEYSLHRCRRAECSEDPLKQWLQTDKVLVVPDKAPVQGLPISVLSTISCRDFQSSTTTKKGLKMLKTFSVFCQDQNQDLCFCPRCA